VDAPHLRQDLHTRIRDRFRRRPFTTKELAVL
jgi:hypothetical protein